MISFAGNFCASAVRITHFHVPEFAKLRDQIRMECAFEMTQGPSEVLHSVKWYRLNYKGQMQEFYSHKPNKNPPGTKHHLHGFRVDVSAFIVYRS